MKIKTIDKFEIDETQIIILEVDNEFHAYHFGVIYIETKNNYRIYVSNDSEGYASIIEELNDEIYLKRILEFIK